jgi:hypothetical protein
MRAGKDVCRVVLILTAGLSSWGCQNGPDPRTASWNRPKPAYPDATGQGSVRAAAPLRITEPPSAVAQAQAPSAEQRPGAAPTPSPSLPALPDLPAPGGVTPVAAAVPAAAPAESDLRRVYRLAAEKYAGMDGYYVCMTRREQVNGKDGAKEVIRLMFRKEPWSVRLVWLDGEAKGREVVYVKGRYEDKLHTRLGFNEHKVIYGPGDHIALAPDSPMVRSSSRHCITEAGVGVLIDHFGGHVAANEKGDLRGGTLTYRGRQKRPEFAEPVETVEQAIPPGAEKELPRGGRRLWMFDASATHLPALIVTTDEAGHEVEYYRYEKYVPVRLDDKDFNPETLWGKS